MSDNWPNSGARMRIDGNDTSRRFQRSIRMLSTGRDGVASDPTPHFYNESGIPIVAADNRRIAKRVQRLLARL